MLFGRSQQRLGRREGGRPAPHPDFCGSCGAVVTYRRSAAAVVCVRVRAHRYYRSVVCALALAATASLKAQGSGSSSTQAAATLHLQAAKVSVA